MQRLSIEISVPSKTFLLGEYAVLAGEGAILLATEPRFKLFANYQDKTSSSVTGIHPESPGGKMLTQDDFYHQYDIRFIDPYHGLGGFGASSAQFVMLYILKKHAPSEIINRPELLKTFEKFAWDGQGFPPSGVDLIGELYGQICYYSKKDDRLKLFDWPFPELGYCLIHTGKKLTTHSHLKEMSHFNVSQLNQITQLGLESIEKQDTTGFIDSINEYKNALLKEHLITKTTKNLLQKFSDCNSILACKGCGALGADVILSIYKLKQEDSVLSFMKNQKLNIIAFGNSIAEGLKLRKS